MTTQAANATEVGSSWRHRAIAWSVVAALIGVAFSLFLVLSAHRTNGRNGFPLDDPWIHLTYARNLHDHHEFTYFPGDPSTQGSTSPLYTILLALGFSLTRDEKVLSYSLGLLFQLLFLATFGAWARRRLEDPRLAVAAVLLVGLDARVGILAVSGMETSLFLFLVALAFHARLARRPFLAGAALGSAVWVRPDGLILLALFGLEALWELRVVGEGARGGAASATPSRGWLARPWVRLVLPALVLTAGYFVFNVAVGGALLPNTFAAKVASYRQNPRLGFLTGDVARNFLFGGWGVLVPFALGSIVNEAVQVFRRRSGRMTLEAAWTLALPLSYFAMLPFAHKFQRYLVPALPGLALLGLGGMAQFVSRWNARRSPAVRPRARQKGPRAPAPAAVPRMSPGTILVGVLIAAALMLHLRKAAAAPAQYGKLCQYYYVRHERTASWLAGNTPANAVVATHDVGALAFYSHRKVVDIVGVVLPEAVAHQHSPDYTEYLAGLFAREGVTHVAALRNWIEVDNISPLFQADPAPEILEVFRWTPGRTHLMPEAASVLNQQAASDLRSGNLSGASRYLQASLRSDDGSSRTWMLYGRLMEASLKLPSAEQAYDRALRLFPEFADARFRHAVVLLQMGERDRARVEVKRILADGTGYPGAAELLEQLGP